MAVRRPAPQAARKHRRAAATESPTFAGCRLEGPEGLAWLPGIATRVVRLDPMERLTLNLQGDHHDQHRPHDR